ncbi:unnamed protein product [Arctia plantaginis]|uniref:Uncharacterized protein n=1 Tax=Arctia plantaginis TaxID=874455 RepID=A0A8S0ZCG2_ARCPL|nr:unnamed protein product [Arctia plantaginis]
MRAPKVRSVAKSVYALKRNAARKLKKPPYNFHDFIILENYRCMPLLGDEEKVPNWEVHIVRFSIVYVNNEKNN